MIALMSFCVHFVCHLINTTHIPQTNMYLTLNIHNTAGLWAQHNVTNKNVTTANECTAKSNTMVL